MRRSVPVVVSICATALIVACLVSYSCAQLYQLSQQEIQTFLDAHNQVRRNVNPLAINIIPDVVWDSAVQANAEASANTCSFAHHGGNYGENLAWSTGYPENWVETAVSQWSRESVDYDIYTDTCANPCLHYTQLVWSNTQRIGCARVQCDTVTYISCQYDPPGNYIGYLPYEPVSPSASSPASPSSTGQEIPSASETIASSPEPQLATATKSEPPRSETGTGSLPQVTKSTTDPKKRSASKTGAGTGTGTGTLSGSVSGASTLSGSGSATETKTKSGAITNTGTVTGTPNPPETEVISQTGTATTQRLITGTGTGTITNSESQPGTATVPKRRSRSRSLAASKSSAMKSHSGSGTIMEFTNVINCKSFCSKQYFKCKAEGKSGRECRSRKKVCIGSCSI